MKKLIISFILLLSLICLAPTATYARAGGASGGGRPHPAESENDGRDHGLFFLK